MNKFEFVFERYIFFINRSPREYFKRFSFEEDTRDLGETEGGKLNCRF